MRMSPLKRFLPVMMICHSYVPTRPIIRSVWSEGITLPITLNKTVSSDTRTRFNGSVARPDWPGRPNPVPYLGNMNKNNSANGLIRILRSDVSLTQPGNYLFIDQIDKVPRIEDLDYDAWRSLVVDNAGGKSSVSEAASINRFVELFGADQILVEKEVEYWISYKMVDFVCTVANQRLGVSVTRAMAVKSTGQPGGNYLDLEPGRFTLDDAVRLLKKKLYGLIVSRNGVTKKCKFYKSILHIWAASQDIADRLTEAWNDGHVDISEFGLDIKGIVVVMITVCSDPTLYLNQYHHEWLNHARMCHNGSTELGPQTV